MEEEVVNKLEGFHLSKQEGMGVDLVDSDVKWSKEECRRSLVVKVFGDKNANFIGMKNTFGKLWSPSGRVKAVELGRNFFQFIFQEEDERNRVLVKSPWFFDNQILVIKPWTEELEEDRNCFGTVAVWVQVKGLPAHWNSKEVGWKIGKLFPLCLNVVIPDSGSKEGRIMKMNLEIDLSKALLRGTKIRLNGKEKWLSFQYEQIPMFCYYCGHVGHNEKHCLVKEKDAREGTIKEGEFGDWIKVGHVRGGNVQLEAVRGEGESDKGGEWLAKSKHTEIDRILKKRGMLEIQVDEGIKESVSEVVEVREEKSEERGIQREGKEIQVGEDEMGGGMVLSKEGDADEGGCLVNSEPMELEAILRDEKSSVVHRTRKWIRFEGPQVGRVLSVGGDFLSGVGPGGRKRDRSQFLLVEDSERKEKRGKREQGEENKPIMVEVANQKWPQVDQ